MHKKSALIVIIIMAVAMLSSIFFGINFTNDTLAKVGKHKITAQDFLRSYREEVSYMERLLNRTINNQQLDSLNIKNEVLNRLIEKKLLINFADSLKITVNNDVLQNHLKKTSFFQTNNKFDRAKFLDILKNNGLNESTYLKTIEEDLKVQALIQSLLLNDEPMPKPIQDQLRLLNFEKRDVSLFEVALENLPSPQPSSEQLLTIYEKDPYFESEKRRGVFAKVNAENFHVNVSETQIEQAIVNNRLNEKLTFISKPKNQEIKEEPAQVKELIVLCKDLLDSPVREQLLNAKIDDEISLEKEIITLKSIQKVSESELKKIKDEVREGLKKSELKSVLEDFIGELNDEIRSGKFKDIKELQNKYKAIELEEVPFTSMEGEGALKHLSYRHLLKWLFDSPIAVVNPFISDKEYEYPNENNSLTYFSFYASEVMPEKMLSLQECQALVECKTALINKWKHNYWQEQAEQPEAAAALIKNSSNSKSMNFYRPEIALSRNPEQNHYPQGLAQKIFITAKGQFTPIILTANKAFVARIENIVPPDIEDSLSLASFRETRDYEEFESNFTQLLSYLSKSYGYTVDSRRLLTSIEE